MKLSYISIFLLSSSLYASNYIPLQEAALRMNSVLKEIGKEATYEDCWKRVVSYEVEGNVNATVIDEVVFNNLKSLEEMTEMMEQIPQDPRRPYTPRPSIRRRPIPTPKDKEALPPTKVALPPVMETESPTPPTKPEDELISSNTVKKMNSFKGKLKSFFDSKKTVFGTGVACGIIFMIAVRR